MTTGGNFVEGYDRDFTKMDPVQSGWADPGYNALYEYTVIRDPSGEDRARHWHRAGRSRTAAGRG